MKTQTSWTVDQVWLGLVPKAVDTKPEVFRDNKKYFSYAEQQVKEFWQRLPEGYVGDVSAKRFRKEKSAVFSVLEPSVNLLMGFKPAYHLLRATAKAKIIIANKRNTITCPTFDLYFRPSERIDAQIMMQAALQQFYLYQQDLEEGTLAARGCKNGKLVLEDLALLRNYFPKGTAIEARCDFALGNGKATYRL